MSDASGKPLVLLGARVPDGFAQRLSERYDVVGPLPAPFPQSVAALPPADAARVRAVITMGTVDTSRAALSCLPALGLVSCIGSGYEGVDLAAAAERGIAVTHSPGANASAVADLALGLLIASVGSCSTPMRFCGAATGRATTRSACRWPRGLPVARSASTASAPSAARSRSASRH